MKVIKVTDINYIYHSLYFKARLIFEKEFGIELYKVRRK